MKSSPITIICLALAVIANWRLPDVSAALMVPSIVEAASRGGNAWVGDGLSFASTDLAGEEPQDEQDSQSDDRNSLHRLLGVLPDGQGGAGGDGVRGAGAGTSYVAVLPFDGMLKQPIRSSETLSQVTDRVNESPRGGRLFRPPRAQA